MGSEMCIRDSNWLSHTRPKYFRSQYRPYSPNIFLKEISPACRSWKQTYSTKSGDEAMSYIPIYTAFPASCKRTSFVSMMPFMESVPPSLVFILRRFGNLSRKNRPCRLPLKPLQIRSYPVHGCWGTSFPAALNSCET